MHKSYACISDHRTHDTVTAHSFLKYFYEYHISKEFRFLEKVFYFSDGSASQCKSPKNVMNLLFHHEDFKLQAEWHFFATSYGKNACDAVVGTIKKLAAHESLQRPFFDQILTPKQLFEFSNQTSKVSPLSLWNQIVSLPILSA